MIAILAILRESWLALRAEKLFKVVLGLNVLVIIAYGSIGFDETGVSMFYGLSHVESEYVYAGSSFAKTLYLGIYSAFIVNIWLAWAASILALVSTSSIFPSMLASGSVELLLSRPTRRTTIMLVKYIGGLLFVMLQVGIFTLGAFMAAGWRIDVWDPTIFLAIPLVTLFYSYLFCVNVLVGILTRSTLVALLATLLFWFSTFGVRTADDVMDRYVLITEKTIERSTKRIDEINVELQTAKSQDDQRAIEDATHWLKRPQEELDLAEKAMDTIKPWHTVIQSIRMVMPETASTIGLLHRELERDAEMTMMDLMTGRAFNEDDEEDLSEEQEAELELQERELQVSAVWIIGKSMIFEIVVLGIGLWLFLRRDF